MPPKPSPGGPYLQAALICEKTLQETGVHSLIRVVDRITIAATGPEVPMQMPPQNLDLTAVIMIKSGDARGRYPLKFRPEAPGGEQRAAIEVALQLEGDERGNVINIELKGLQLDREGLWWFDILFGDDETLMTRMPLRLVYQPQKVVVTTGETEPDEPEQPE